MYVALVVLLVLLGISLFLEDREDLVRMSIDAPRGVAVGDTFDVTITVRGAESLAGVQVSAQYDDHVLSLVSHDPGGMLSEDGAVETFEVDPQKSPGLMEKYAVVRLAQGGVDGSGDVVVLRFTALAEGVSQIDLTDVKLSDSAGRTLPVTVSPVDVRVR